MMNKQEQEELQRLLMQSQQLILAIKNNPHQVIEKLALYKESLNKTTSKMDQPTPEVIDILEHLQKPNFNKLFDSKKQDKTTDIECVVPNVYIIPDYSLLTRFVISFVDQNLPLLGGQYDLNNNPIQVSNRTITLEDWLIVVSLIRDNRLKPRLSQKISTFPKKCKYISSMLIFDQVVAKAIFKTLFQSQFSQEKMKQKLSLQYLNQLSRSYDTSLQMSFTYEYLLSKSFPTQETLQAREFHFHLQKYMDTLENYFYSENLITRLMKIYGNQRQIVLMSLFQQFLLLFNNFKHALLYDLSRFSATDEEIITKEKFLQIVKFQFYQKKLPKMLEEVDFLNILPQLFMLENLIVEQVCSIDQESDITSNHFTKAVEKIRNQCANDGKDSCLCSRCGCLRRNRDSARESQKRKREALEEYVSLQENYEILGKKSDILEKENEHFKSLLKQIFSHPTIDQMINVKSQVHLMSNNEDNSFTYDTEC